MFLKDCARAAAAASALGLVLVVAGCGDENKPGGTPGSGGGGPAVTGGTGNAGGNGGVGTSTSPRGGSDISSSPSGGPIGPATGAGGSGVSGTGSAGAGGSGGVGRRFRCGQFGHVGHELLGCRRRDHRRHGGHRHAPEVWRWGRRGQQERHAVILWARWKSFSPGPFPLRYRGKAIPNIRRSHPITCGARAWNAVTA